jgi:hypothetical protein
VYGLVTWWGPLLAFLGGATVVLANLPRALASLRAFWGWLSRCWLWWKRHVLFRDEWAKMQRHGEALRALRQEDPPE